MLNEKASKKTNKKPSTMAVKRAYDYIRDISINYKMRPGEQINEVEIAYNLQMSRVPVRESLNRLVMNGFVTLDSRKGFFFRKFSETEMINLYSIRQSLETTAVIDACSIGSENDISIIKTNWSTISKEQADKTIDELVFLDAEFHLSVVALSGNKERVKILKNIYERTRFIRKISIENEERRYNIVKEHLKLIDAILSRDEKGSLEILKYHLGFNSQELKSNIHIGMLRIYESDIV